MPQSQPVLAHFTPQHRLSILQGRWSKHVVCMGLYMYVYLQVLQRSLPRPLAQTMTPDPLPAGPVGPSHVEAAESLLTAEVNALLQHEALLYPLKKRKRGQGGTACLAGP